MEIVFSDSSKTTKTKILDFLNENPDALTKQCFRVTIHESGAAAVGRYSSTIHVGPPYFGRADETAEIVAGEVATCVKRQSHRVDRAQIEFFDPPARTAPGDAGA
jgi:hypothetical protein